MKYTLFTVAALIGALNAPLATPMDKKDPLADFPYFNKTENGYQLEFDDKHYRTLETTFNGQTIRFRAFEKIVYVQNPLEPDYQTLNIYVPEAYFQQGEINGFNAQTAPIFLPNAVGGYMPAKAATYDSKGMGNRGNKPNAITTALARGYVVASVGARGRTLEQQGKYTGKAPAAIVDLKSAVRYLHFNDSRMAGDANKIISNGTSAGGALSALLGASGDHADYTDYFNALGAAAASDAVFAVSAYCPITNLEHADMAYEWQFNGLNRFSRIDMSQLNAATFNDRSKPMPRIEGELSAEQIALSDQLKTQFPAYLNSLGLKDQQGNALTLDAQGNGSFKEYVKSLVVHSADLARKSGVNVNDAWLTLSKEGVSDLDWNGYIHSEKRMKSPPAFDALDLSSGENDLFGSTDVKARHFTLFSFQQGKGEMADRTQIKLMNPLNYLEQAKVAQHWRIRHGASDRDTSVAIPTILALKLQNLGKNVDYFVPWAQGHGGDYDLDELFNWTDRISQGK